jgi:branched-chain amino acid transport system ATP-binding protein
MAPILTTNGVVVHYGAIQALTDASIEVNEGEIVAVIGGNGSGKSTLLKAIAGVVKPTLGEINFMGKAIQGLPAEKVIRLGLAMAPANHVVFPDSSVYMNLEVGAYVRNDFEGIKKDINFFFNRFPNLSERRNQKAGLLSGGEQQMLSIARALMSHPKVLLLDEPSIGLAPAVMHEVFRYIKEIREQGTTVLLVEQNARQALAIADRGYVLANSCIVLGGTAKELTEADQVQKAYFGG